jgi:hypothetical protein
MKNIFFGFLAMGNGMIFSTLMLESKRHAWLIPRIILLIASFRGKNWKLTYIGAGWR